MLSELFFLIYGEHLSSLLQVLKESISFPLESFSFEVS